MRHCRIPPTMFPASRVLSNKTFCQRMLQGAVVEPFERMWLIGKTLE